MNRRSLLKTLLLAPFVGVFKRKKVVGFGWISVDEKLPKDKTYVLAIHNRGTWKDQDDPERVNVVVVKFVRGLSEEERMSGNRTYTPADEGFNNEKPYYWSRFGPDCFFGQSIIYWKPIVMP